MGGYLMYYRALYTVLGLRSRNRNVKRRGQHGAE